MIDLEALRFPVGKFNKPATIQKEDIRRWMDIIQGFPDQLRSTTEGLTKAQLAWRYRPEGWCIQQLVHHCADSHMNSLIRFKLALTEDTPTIRPYFEDRWAELPDTVSTDISISLDLLTAVHARWMVLLRSLTNDQLQRAFVHPDSGRHITLDENIGIYAWHCEHHLAHVRQALQCKGAFP